MTNNKIKIFTDGGARGNPGPAGIGVVIYDENGNLIKQKSEFIGHATNNQAEYRAVISAFELLSPDKPNEINFFLDSELVVKQIRREYKVKNKDLAPLFLKIHNFIVSHKKVTFQHIPREQNKEADKLANQAMDQAGNN